MRSRRDDTCTSRTQAGRGAHTCAGPALDLVIAPGAFGSGEHVTTASCLEILQGLGNLAGASVLDLGCGTGILGIAALRLGARRAVLLDVDPAAAATARRNCRANGVAAAAYPVVGSLAAAVRGPFDLILANLHADLLLASASSLVHLAASEAHLLLSGILWEDDFAVCGAYQRLGCRLVRHVMRDEYSTLHLLGPRRLGA